MVLAMFAVLDKTNGNPIKHRDFLTFRKIEIFKNRHSNSDRIQIILGIGSVTYIVYPLCALLGWFLLVLFDRFNTNQSWIPAVSIILVGLAFFFIMYNFMLIQWNAYQFTGANIIIVILAVIFMTCYQGLIIFGYDDDKNRFIPWTSFFLVFNLLVITIGVLFEKYADSKDLLMLMQKSFPRLGNNIDRKRENILSEEIEEQRSNSNWKCSFEDLVDFITMAQVSMPKFQTMIGSNVIQKFNQKGICFKVTIQVLLSLFAIIILGVYAFVMYWFNNNDYTGIAVSISITLLDLFNYALYLAGAIDQPTSIIILLVINRVVMIGLGDGYWVYSIIILYIVYGTCFALEIARKRFPYDDDVDLKIEITPQLVKKQKSCLISFKNFVTQPEFLLLIVTLAYVGLMFMIQFVYWTGKHVEPFIFYYGDQKQTMIQIGYLSLFTVGLVFTLFLIINFFRIMSRNIKKTEKVSSYLKNIENIIKKVPCCKPFYDICSIMAVTMVMIFMVSVGWLIFATWLTDSVYTIVWGICATIMILFYFRALYYFALNDFSYFQDINQLNISIDNHNKKIKELEKRQIEVRKKIKSGALFADVAQLPGIVEPQLNATTDSNMRSSDSSNQKLLPSPDMTVINLLDPNHSDSAKPQETSSLVAIRQKNAKLIKLMQQEEAREKLEQERRQKEFDKNPELIKQLERERILMIEQIVQEKQLKEKKLDKLNEEKKAKELEIAEAQRKQLQQQKKVEASKPLVITKKIDSEEVEQTKQQKEKQNDGMYEGGDTIYEGGSGALIPGQTQVVQSVQKGGVNLIQTVPWQNWRNKIQLQQQTEYNKTYLDIDEAELLFDGQQQMEANRLKRVTNWRLLHKNNWLVALCAGNLRPHDTSFMISIFIAFLAWLGLLIGLTVVYRGFYGALVMVPTLYFAVSFVIASSVLYQSRPFSWKELALWIFVTVIYFGLAFAFFFINFDIQKFKFPLKKVDYTQLVAAYFVIFYVLIIPTILHAVICFLRILERGFDGFIENFKYFIGFVVAGLLLVVIAAFLFIYVIEGAVLIGLIMFIVFITGQILMYFHNDFALISFWLWFDGILAFIVMIAPLAASFLTDILTIYQGMSVSCGILVGYLWFYAIANFVRDFNQMQTRPVFFSNSIFPIYKFNERTREIDSHHQPVAAWIIGLNLIMIWGLLTNTQVNPKWFGAFITIVIEAIMVLTLVMARTFNILTLNDAFLYLDEKVSKQAWLSVKESYYKQMGAMTAPQIFSYRRLWKHRYFLTQYLSILQTQKPKTLPKDIQEDLVQEITPSAGSNDLKKYLRTKIEEFHGTEYLDYEKDDEIMALKLTYKYRMQNAFKEELKQIICFILLASASSRTHKKIEEKEFFNFLKEKNDILITLGIRIVIPKTGSTDSQYLSVMQQIQDLDEDHLEAFYLVQDLAKQENLKKKNISQAARDDELNKQAERDKQVLNLQKQRKQQLLELEKMMEGKSDVVDINMDIDNMPDCRLKYKIIMKRAKEKKQKFIDKQFPAADSSLGNKVVTYSLQNADRKWIRVSESTAEGGIAYSVFKDGASYDDAVQGSLGDCYFISCLAVLGQKNTRNCFVFIERDDEFMDSGAFCIRFCPGGKETIVIIDDQFLFMNDEFPFAKSPGGELWPMILEKAYAKLYGSYESIIGGSLANALSELVEGCPKKLVNEKIPPNQLWDEVLRYSKLGFPLGAGSPSHPDGDSHITEEGIAQGHAYSIIKAVQADDNRLIQIRNPWGYGEWNGEWSDQSEKWTKRIKNIVGFKEVKEEDGIFWMDFNDFIRAYECVYVCITFSQELGWTSLDVVDKWSGTYAQGLPTRENKTAKLTNSPQYSLKITKPGKVYVVYRLKEKLNRQQSILYGFLQIQNNKGGLIEQNDKAKTVGSVGPSNSVQQDIEIDLAGNLTYPLNLTVIASFVPPKENKSDEYNFSIKIYTQDAKATIQKIN